MSYGKKKKVPLFPYRGRQGRARGTRIKRKEGDVQEGGQWSSCTTHKATKGGEYPLPSGHILELTDREPRRRRRRRRSSRSTTATGATTASSRTSAATTPPRARAPRRRARRTRARRTCTTTWGSRCSRTPSTTTMFTRSTASPSTRTSTTSQSSRSMVITSGRISTSRPIGGGAGSTPAVAAGDRTRPSSGPDCTSTPSSRTPSSMCCLTTSQ